MSSRARGQQQQGTWRTTALLASRLPLSCPFVLSLVARSLVLQDYKSLGRRRGGRGPCIVGWCTDETTQLPRPLLPSVRARARALQDRARVAGLETYCSFLERVMLVVVVVYNALCDCDVLPGPGVGAGTVVSYW